MSMTDPISDLLTRIRNGYMSSKRAVELPHSKIKEGIATVLKEEGFIGAFHVTDAVAPAVGRVLHIDLKYRNSRPSIVSLRRISKPSCRIYRGADDVNSFATDRYSVTIVSTPGGVMSYQRASRARLGGEILCVIS